MPLYENFRNYLVSLFQGITTPSVTGTSEQSVLPGGMGSPVIAPNRLKAGSTVRILLRGVMSSPLVSGSMTVKIKLNGTVISSGTVSTLLGSLNKGGWALNQTISVRSAGTNGTAVVAGDVSYPSGTLSNKSKTDLYSDPAVPFALDTTVAQAIDVTFQFGLSSHTIWTSTCTVEILDQ